MTSLLEHWKIFTVFPIFVLEQNLIAYVHLLWWATQSGQSNKGFSEYCSIRYILNSAWTFLLVPLLFGGINFFFFREYGFIAQVASAASVYLCLSFILLMLLEKAIKSRIVGRQRKAPK